MSNATSIQGTPVISGTPATGAVLQYNGTEYVTVVPADGEVIGQNALSTSWASSLDDTPLIQAWITQNTVSGACRGTLKLVNPVLKTALNLSAFAGTYSKIIIYGTCRYAMNVAEFNMPASLTISGEGGGNSGINSLEGPCALMQGYNSTNTTVQEPNNSTTDAYVGAYEYMWISGGMSALPASQVGSTLTVSAVGAGSSAFIGSYTVAAVQSNGDVRLVWNGSGAPTYTESATGCTWACGTYSGNTLAFSDFSQRIPVLPIYNCKNLTNASYYHWMALSNASNADLTTKIHRIMGIASSTTAYVIGANLQQTHSLTLPDYGSGGTSGAPTIQVYEAFPVFRMTGYCKVSNISAYGNQSPVFVMDGTDNVTQWCTVENCETGQNQVTPAPAFVSLINDGVFFFNINKCFFYTYSTSNQPANLYFTGTNGTVGQYCGIGRIQDCLFTYYGAVSRQESVFPGCQSIEYTNTWVDPPLAYPGLAYECFHVIDGGATNIKFINSQLADQETPCYVVETLSTAYANLNESVIYVSDITVDFSAVGAEIVFGPNLAAAGIDLTINGSPFWDLATPTSPVNALTQYSASYQGYVDNAEIDRNASFSPVMQLPYQLTLPALLTAANWNALTQTGTITASTTGLDGYPLWGPDLSSGKVIRISASAANSFFTVASWNITTPQVGDVLLTFMRVRSVSTTSNAGLAGAYVLLFSSGNDIVFNSYPGTQYISPLSPLVSKNTGGQWQNSIGYHVVTAVNSTPGNLTFRIGMPVGDDIVIDPESIALCYLPISASGVEAIPVAEIVRLYRKMSGQITGATPGDIAIPTRAGISFGGASRNFTRFVSTSTTSATPIYSLTVPTSEVFQIQATWVAVNSVSSGAVSGGTFTITGYNNAGTLTVSSVNTLGTNYNAGSGGAAASAPITATASGATLSINVVAENSTKTDWQMTFTQVVAS